MERTSKLEQNGKALDSEAITIPNTAAIREHLEKILSSRTFRAADGQRNFLRYVVEQALDGGTQRIKEYSVGVEVFHRGESFDPRQDSIVRVEARKLRARLAKYYEEEGQRDPVRIEFPKGSYAPLFREAQTATQQPDPLVIEESAPAEASGAPLAKQSLPAKPPAMLRRVAGWKAVAAMVAALLVSGTVAYWGIRHRENTLPGGASIAVLPFANLSSDKSDEFFSDGLTEELIDSLARVPGLRVVARTSAFQYKGQSQDVRKVGRELNVRNVLEGSVRRYGNLVRITTQLNDASNGFQLWAANYEREMKDILAVQREISQSITTALGAQLTGKNTPAGNNSFPGDAPALNPDAYQDYLRGLSFFNKRTAEDTRSAIGYFQQAIAKDGNYALAYLGLAHSYAAIPMYAAIPSREASSQIRTAAARALALDSTLGEAHVDLALAFMYDYEWSAAEGEFRKALALNPGDSFAHTWHGTFLVKMGRVAEAMEEQKTALNLDPVSTNAAGALARALYHARRYDDAILQYKNAVRLNPDFGVVRQGLGLAYLKAGNYAEGIGETQAASHLMGGDSMIQGQLGYAYALSGESAKAKIILSELLSRSSLGSVRALPIAHIYIGLGDKDRAFEWLQLAIDQRDINLWLKTDAFYDPLRQDSRFSELLRRMRLP